jgi:hypothetical protein
MRRHSLVMHRMTRGLGGQALARPTLPQPPARSRCSGCITSEWVWIDAGAHGSTMHRQRRGQGRLMTSELVEVALHLPVGDLRPVLVPLGALCVDVVIEDVVTEGVTDHLVTLELLKGFAERPG